MQEFIARNGLISKNNSEITGSLSVTNGITGSFKGNGSQITDVVHLVGDQIIAGNKTFTDAINIIDDFEPTINFTNNSFSGSLKFTDGFEFTEGIYGPSFIKTGGTASQFLKADGSIDESDVVRNIAKNAAQGANITGTVSETILYSKLIPANTFKDGDFMTLFSRIVRPSPTASSESVDQRVRINTSNTLTGSIIIARNILIGGVNGNQFVSMQRTFNVTNGFLVGATSSQSYPLDIINANSPPQFNVFDPTVDNYIFITGQLGFSGDTMFNLGTKITN